MSQLDDKITLKHLQKFVARFEREMGFDEQTAMAKCLLLGEEVGELFKAVRQRSGLGMSVGTDAPDVAEELADVLIFLAAIANRFSIDLEEAFRSKHERNGSRQWRTTDSDYKG